MDSAQQNKYVALLMKNQGKVRAFITVLLPRRSDVEDVCQQTYAVLWEKRDQFDADREFLPWAYGIARREVLKHADRHRRERVYLSETAMSELADVQQRTTFDDQAHRDALAHCMQKLERQKSELLQHCYLGDRTIKSIAERLDLSPATLYMRLKRIRKVLFECVVRVLAAEGR